LVSMSVIGKQMWVGCASGNIRIWETETGQMLENRLAHTGPVQSIALVKDQVWTSSKDKVIIVWALQKSQPVKKVGMKEGHSNAILEVDQFIWLACSDGVVRLLDKNMKSKKDMKVDNSALLCMLKRSNQVYIGTHHGSIHVWNTTTLKHQKTILGHTGPVVGFTTVGPTAFPSEIWSCSYDKTIRCWNVESGDCIKVLPSLSNVLCLLQIRANCHVISGNEGPTIDVWNAKTYEIMAELPSNHKSGVAVMAYDFLNQVWCGSSDNSVGIWR